MGTHYKGLRDFDWKRRDCEIWMFNEAPNVKDKEGKKIYKKPDFLFQLHNQAIWKNPINRSDAKHYKWLKSKNAPPTYMQKKFQDVPNSIEYPIKNVLSLVKNIKINIDGKEKDFKYFSSTPDYALALVAELWNKGKKYKNVEIYGIELELETEYVYQRMGFGFWLGVLAGMGIPVKIYSSIFNEPMYGYEGDLEISSKEIEKRINDLEKELGDDKKMYSDEANTFLLEVKHLSNKDVSSDIQTELNRIITENEHSAILNGKIFEARKYLEKAKQMEKTSGASIFSPGEFDDYKIRYQKLYEDLRLHTAILNAQMTDHLARLKNLKKGSSKRRRAVDELGKMIADFMNKNMQIFHYVGNIKENQFYLDSYRQGVKSWQ